MKADHVLCKECYLLTKNIRTRLCKDCKLVDILKIDIKKAQKFDDNKPPLDLIPYSALELEARVLAFGAKKYDAHNWRQGMDWSRLIGAALRHVNAFNAGEDLDPESGLSHLGHARCCLGFLIEYQKKGLGTDDRYNKDKT